LKGSPGLLPHQCGIDGIVDWERKTVLDRRRGGALREIPDVSRCGELNGGLGLCV